MKKAIKVIVGILVVIVLAVVALVATLPLWLGPVVKPSAAALVPKLTQTAFKMAHLALNPYTGRFELGGMELSNPSNYSERVAARVGNFVVDVDMGSVAGDVIHIEEITVEDVFVSYVYADGVANFDQIQYNLAGGKEKYEAKKAAQEQAADEAAKTEEEAARDAVAEECEAINKKKFVIDRLTISGLKVKLGPLPIPLPPLKLTDIGKASDGATLSEVWASVLEVVTSAMGGIADGAKALGNLFGQGAKSVGEGAGKAGGAVIEQADKAVDALKSLFK